ELPDAEEDRERDEADDEVVQRRAATALGGDALGARLVVGQGARRVGGDGAHAISRGARVCCGRAVCSSPQMWARSSAKRGSARSALPSRGWPNGTSSTSLMRPGRALITAMRSPSRIASSIEWVMNTMVLRSS